MIRYALRTTGGLSVIVLLAVIATEIPELMNWNISSKLPGVEVDSTSLMQDSSLLLINPYDGETKTIKGSFGEIINPQYLEIDGTEHLVFGSQQTVSNNNFVSSFFILDPYRNKLIKSWSIPFAENIRMFDPANPIKTFTFSKDGEQIFLKSYSNITGSDDIVVLDTLSGEKLKIISLTGMSDISFPHVISADETDFLLVRNEMSREQQLINTATDEVVLRNIFGRTVVIEEKLHVIDEIHGLLELQLVNHQFSFVPSSIEIARVQEINLLTDSSGMPLMNMQNAGAAIELRYPDGDIETIIQDNYGETVLQVEAPLTDALSNLSEVKSVFDSAIAEIAVNPQQENIKPFGMGEVFLK